MIGETVEWNQVQGTTTEKRRGLVVGCARGGQPSGFHLLIKLPDGTLTERGVAHLWVVHSHDDYDRLHQAIAGMGEIGPSESVFAAAARLLDAAKAELIAADEDREKLRQDVERLEGLLKEARAKVKKPAGPAGPDKPEAAL